MAEGRVKMIFFLLPVYNEQDNIKRLISDVSAYAKRDKYDYYIVISDDGSSDGTVKLVEEVADSLPVMIVASPSNVGPGSAFDKGFRKILERASKADIVITMEADNTSDLSIVGEMLRKIEEGSDLVLASCYAREGKVVGITLMRKILSISANFITGLLFGGKGIRTYSSFYRCYTVDILDKAYKVYGDDFIREKGFVCAAEILLKLLRLDALVVEVPMVLMCKMRVGRSKMKTFKTTLSYLSLFLREGLGKWGV
jgi:dolichol-phosphate mannosyltransferase